MHYMDPTRTPGYKNKQMKNKGLWGRMLSFGRARRIRKCGRKLFAARAPLCSHTPYCPGMHK